MTLQLLYWILMLLWLIGGVWSTWPGGGQPARAYWGTGGSLLLFILLLILGWATFGAPIK